MRSIAAGIMVGAVLASPLPTTESVDQPGAIAVISRAEIATTTVTDIESLLSKIPGVASYRFGDDPHGTATLDRDVVPAATPDLIGAMVLRPGTAGFGGLDAAIQGSSSEYQTVGNGLNDLGDYLFFIATRAGQTTASPQPGLVSQIEFPIGFAGETGWVAQSKFPGDTWQGASLVLSSQLTLEGKFTTTLYDVGNGFAPLPFNGLFARGPDWAMAAVDWGTLEAYNPRPVSWGFASHVHDGSFGSCSTCASIVTAYPPVPRTSADLYPLAATAIDLDKPTAEETRPPTATDQSGTLPWLPLVIIGFVLLFILIALSWFLSARRKEPTACDRERREWEDAKRRLEAARELLESQHEAFNERMARVTEVETLLAEYEQALEGPTAVSGGTEFARLDGELIVVSDLKELIGHLKADLADARSDADRERVELDRRLARFTEAEEQEAAARAAYEACMAAAAASSEAASSEGTKDPPPTSTGRGGSSTPGVVVAPPMSSTPRADCGCDSDTASSPVAVPVGAAERFRLFRDFDVISHVEESSQHGADLVGADLVTGLKDAGVTLTTIGSALSGRNAALGGAKAVGSLQTGKFVKGSLEAVKGTVDGLGAIDVIPNVPTSLPEAVAQGLAATANLGAFVAGKVTEWMGKNTLVSVHATYYFQTVTIQPTQIWVCEDGVWKCKTKVNVYTVGSLERERGRDQQFTVKSEPERRALRVHVATLASRGRLRITNSVAHIATWEAAHPTGDCP